MGVLHNRISQKELKQRLYLETDPRVTLSFYRYCTITHTQEYRDMLYQQLYALNVFGRIYIATEGINAQISVPQSFFESLKSYLNSTLILPWMMMGDLSGCLK